MSKVSPMYYFMFQCLFTCKLYIFLFYRKVISGHTGWVRSVTVEPGNQWFATGSADRTIKVNY